MKRQESQGSQITKNHSNHEKLKKLSSNKIPIPNPPIQEKAKKFKQDHHKKYRHTRTKITPQAKSS